MEKFFNFLRALTSRYQGLSPGKKVAVLSLAGLALASLFVMSLWIKQPDYQLLYANLSPEDASAIVDQLKNQKIDYELTNRGRNIRIPSDKVYETRIGLASEGLPEGSDVGLELFDDTPLGMTEFVQKLNFQRALQGELARTIKSLEAIDQARVHLVIPKDNVFLKDKPKGKASIMIKIKPGRTLSESQVQGIVHLVSSSVDGILAQDVVVVDLKGDILSGGKEGFKETLITASNYKHQKQVERELENDIVEMLEEALGAGKIIAQVSAEINFEKVEKTEEIFDPDSQVVRSEQLATENVVGAAPPAGIPGASSLLPTGESGEAASSGTPASKNKENQTFNYEINKVVRRTSIPTGEIKKLSVGVLIDGTVTGDPLTYQPRTKQEMAKYLEIIKSAMGYDKVRGDQIKLENVEFDKSLILERQAQLAEEEKYDLITLIAKILAGVILVVLFFARVVRPLITWLTTSVEAMPKTKAALPSPEEVAVAEEERRLSKLTTETSEMRDAVTDFVESDPKYAAGVLRKWMRDRSV